MAASGIDSSLFTSEQVLEEMGSVLVYLSKAKICLLRNLETDEVFLPTIRRFCGETREAAAMRKVVVETEIPSRLLPLNMYVRAPPAFKRYNGSDEPRLHFRATEPFHCQICGPDQGCVRIIWWLALAVDEKAAGFGELDCPDICLGSAIEFCDLGEAEAKLTFGPDREIAKRAIKLFKESYDGYTSSFSSETN